MKMFWKLLLFICSLRFILCFEFVIRNDIRSVIELSRYGLFRNSIHKFSISNLHLISEIAPLVVLSVEKSRSLDLPYPVVMRWSSEYVCLVAEGQKAHPHRLIFQIDFQTKSLITLDSRNVFATINLSNKTKLAEGQINNRTKTELAIAMTSSSVNNRSTFYNLDFQLSIADSETDEGLYRFHLHNCDRVPMSFSVLTKLVDFEMIVNYFFTSQFSLDSVIYVLYNTYIYCTYMLNDLCYLIMRYLNIFSYFPHYINVKSLPLNSFSFLILQPFRDILDKSYDLPWCIRLGLQIFTIGRIYPEVPRSLFLLPFVIDYLTLCEKSLEIFSTSLFVENTNRDLIYIDFNSTYNLLCCLSQNEYLLAAVYSSLFNIFFFMMWCAWLAARNGLSLRNSRYDELSHVLFFVSVDKLYNVSNDLVLKLFIAHELPFHFAWIQFMIEDVLAVAYLLFCCYNIKQIDLMVSKKRETLIVCEQSEKERTRQENDRKIVHSFNSFYIETTFVIFVSVIVIFAFFIRLNTFDFKGSDNFDCDC